jgi:hypothetical protein
MGAKRKNTVGLDNRLTGGGEVSSLTHRPRSSPHKHFLVLVCVRGWIDNMAIVRMEGIRKLRKKMISVFELACSIHFWNCHTDNHCNEINLCSRYRGGKPERKRPLQCGWVENIKKDFGGDEWGTVDCIDLAQDRVQWGALVDTTLSSPWVAVQLVAPREDLRSMKPVRTNMHQS